MTVMNPGGARVQSVGILELEPGIPPKERMVALGVEGAEGIC